MNQQPIRVLIADDEPAARRGIRALLRDFPEARVVGEAAHGLEVVEQVAALNPDLVFLDIQMPECDGLEAIHLIGVEAMPPVIFVTAYDRYALDAFAVHAFDYLLKPMDKARFAETWQRAVMRIRQASGSADRLAELMAQLARDRPRPQERFVIRETGRLFFVQAAEVHWIEAAGNYVELHTGKRTHLLRDSLTHLAEVLDPKRFIRVSRSALINLDLVAEFQPVVKGAYDILFPNGDVVRSSRRFAANLHFLSQG